MIGIRATTIVIMIDPPAPLMGTLAGYPANARVLVRELESSNELSEAQALLDELWTSAKDQTPTPLPLLRAFAHAGGFVAGGYIGRVMLGAAVGFRGVVDEEPVLHSHIVGVRPEAQNHGIGFALKQAQLRWARRNGLVAVTWTFDPMLRRNAYFNMHKLGACGIEYHRDFYGDMDDAVNKGDHSDRLLVRWPVPTSDGESEQRSFAPHDAPAAICS